MSTHLPGQFDEPRRRTIWLFDPSDHEELARLRSQGWRQTYQQSFAGRVRVDLVEPKRRAIEEDVACKPGRQGKWGTR